jgi:prepilin-type N-terminal cleavage/methylation domain-containing protein
MKIIRRTGFTLLDIIIVMAIMAVVAAMGAPKLATALRRRTTATAADQLVTAHSLARATAVRYGRTAQLHIDAAAKKFWVDVDTSANLIGQRATIWYARDMSQTGVTISSTRSLLCFDARGIASTAGTCQAGDAQVVFTDVDRADTVTTTSLGKVLR